MPPVAEDVDAGQAGADHRRRDGGRPVAAGRDREGQVGAAQLHYAGRPAEPLERVGVEPDPYAAAEDDDRGRNGTASPHEVLDRAGRLDVGRVGHAVGDDGRFERHDAHPACQRVGDLRRQVERNVWESHVRTSVDCANA